MERASAQIIAPSPRAQDEARHADVLICGGGISGLSLAAWLDKAVAGAGDDGRAGGTGRDGGALQTVVLDQNAQPGGVIGTIHQDGFIFERGPNTILDKHESFDELIAFAALENEIIRAPMKDFTRYVWLRGALRPVPTGPLDFITTPLLPLGAKLALLGEPLVPCKAADESVADFVRRRLGEAWVRNLIVPMVSGIWAGDPEKLSIEHAFPIMKEMERDGGSIVRGAMRRMKRTKKEREREGKARRVRHLVSFKDGLQRLPEALAARMGERYCGGTRIERVERVDAGEGGDGARWRVITREARGNKIENENGNENGNGKRIANSGGNGEGSRVWTARHLVLAAEGERAGGWIDSFDSEAAALLRSFPYNRLVVAALGIEMREAQLPRGFGFLAPRGEGIRLLGAIINSNFLPGRAPEGCAALTIFIGGELDPAACDLSDDELIGLLKRDLRAALGWSGKYRSLRLERWPRAIPQYDMNHGDRMRHVAEVEARHPGLHLAGNWKGGVAIADRVECMKALAGEIAAKFAERSIPIH